MNNLKFWNQAIDLIEDLATRSAEDKVTSNAQKIASFVEINQHRFDPADDFQEYVLVRFARAVTEQILLNHSEDVGNER